MQDFGILSVAALPALSSIKKGDLPCPHNDIASEVRQQTLWLRAEEQRTYLPKLTDPQGKQSPSEGMVGGASKPLGRGMEDDAAGGNRDTIFN